MNPGSKIDDDRRAAKATSKVIIILAYPMLRRFYVPFNHR
jgi:hypothetical protein